MKCKKPETTRTCPRIGCSSKTRQEKPTVTPTELHTWVCREPDRGTSTSETLHQSGFYRKSSSVGDTTRKRQMIDASQWVWSIKKDVQGIQLCKAGRDFSQNNPKLQSLHKELLQNTKLYKWKISALASFFKIIIWCRCVWGISPPQLLTLFFHTENIM